MATKTWASSGSSSWNTAGNWSPSGVPGASDDVVFNATSTNNCTVDVAIEVTTLTITTGYTGTLDFGDSGYSHSIGSVVADGTASIDYGNATITVTGNFDTRDCANITVGTSTLVSTGDGAIVQTNYSNTAGRLYNLTFSNNGSFRGSISGALEIASGKSVLLNYADSAAAIVGGSINNSGTMTVSTQLNFALNSSITAWGTLSGSGTMYLKGTPTSFGLPVGTCPLGIEISNSGGFNSTGTWALAGNVTFQKNFTISDGGSNRFVVFNTNNYSITFQGDVTLSIDAADLTYNKGTGTITFSGSGTNSIDFNGEAVEDFVINKTGGGGIVLTADVQTDSVTISGGNLYANTVDLDVTGNFTLAAGTSVQDGEGTSAVISIGGNLAINGTSGSGCIWTGCDLDTLTGTGSASYCEVTDSTNSSGTAIDATDNCTDSGGNTGWTFTAGLGDWTKRKAIVIDGDKIVGGPHGAMPVVISLRDADIRAGAQSDGRDLRFTESDGSTELAYRLRAIPEYATDDGVWTWYSDPRAVYHEGTYNRLFVALTKFAGTLVEVAQYDYDTGEWARKTLAHNVTEIDDHNNPAIYVRQDGKLLVSYTQHPGNYLQIAKSPSAESVDGTWTANNSFDPAGYSGAYDVYTYSNFHRLSAEGTSGRLYLFYRVSGVSTTKGWWGYVTSDDDGDTWGSQTKLLEMDDESGTYTPYPRFVSNGTDRIDMVWSRKHPNQGCQQILHCYLSGGTWHDTDGTSLSLPSNGFLLGDLGSTSIVLDTSAGSDTCWTVHADYDSSGYPMALIARFVGDSSDAGNYVLATWSGSAWSTETITAAGDSLIDTATYGEQYYIGGGALVPGDETQVYLSVQSGTDEHQIQLWEKDGSWAKASDLTTPSTHGPHANFRPVRVSNGDLLWAHGYYRHYASSFVATPYKTQIRAALSGAQFDSADVVVTGLENGTDTTLYCYYGNAAATDDQSYLTGINLIRYWRGLGIGEHDPYNMEDLVGGQALAMTETDATLFPPANAQMGSVGLGPQYVGARATGWATEGSLGAIAFAGKAEWSIETYLQYSSSGTDEHNVWTTWGSSSTVARTLIRLEPTDDSVEAFAVTSAGQIGGTLNTAGSVPANTPKYLAVVFDSDGGASGDARLSGRVGTSEAHIDLGSSAAMDADTHLDPELFNSHSSLAINTDNYQGALWMLRVTDDALSTDWTGTISGNLTDASFLALGSEEDLTSSGVTVEPPATALALAGQVPVIAAGAAVSIPATALALDGQVPVIAAGAAVSIPATALALDGQVPVIAAGAAVSIPATALALDGQVPVIAAGAAISIPVTALSLAALTPLIGSGTNVTVPAVALDLAGLAPVIGAGAEISVPLTDFVLAALEPFIGSAAQVEVPLTALGLSGAVPTISAGANVEVPAASVTLSAYVPSIGASVLVEVPVTDLALAGLQAVITTGASVAVPVTTVSVAGLLPSIEAGAVVTVPVTNLALAGLSPRIGTGNVNAVHTILLALQQRDVVFTLNQRTMRFTVH
jgi:hypothetical protein